MKNYIKVALLSILGLLALSACRLHYLPDESLISSNASDSLIESTLDKDSESIYSTDYAVDSEVEKQQKPVELSTEIYKNRMIGYYIHAFCNHWRGWIPTYYGIINGFGTEPLVEVSDTHAYVKYQLEEGGEFYIFFSRSISSDYVWVYRNSIYKLRDLQYSDFGNLTGKTFKDVVQIDDIALLYEAMSTPDRWESDIWESRHLLTDGILIIRYNKNNGNAIEEVIYNEDYSYEFAYFKEEDLYCYYYNIK